MVKVSSCWSCLFLVIVAALLFAHQLFFHPLCWFCWSVKSSTTVLAGSSNCSCVIVAALLFAHKYQLSETLSEVSLHWSGLST